MLNNDDILLAIAQRKPQDVTDYVYRMSYPTSAGNGRVDTGQSIVCVTNGKIDYYATIEATVYKRFRCGHYIQSRNSRVNIFTSENYPGRYTTCVWSVKTASGFVQNLFTMSNWGYNLSRQGHALRLSSDDTVWLRKGRDVLFKSEPIDPTSWHHYVITWDRDTNTSQFFIDGVKLFSDVIPFVPKNSDTQLHLNHFEGSASNMPEAISNAYYADHRVYGRVLSDDEVQTVFKQLSWKM